MASSKAYLDFILEQLSGLEEVNLPGYDGGIYSLLSREDRRWDL